jgi:hypothetical protein
MTMMKKMMRMTQSENLKIVRSCKLLCYIQLFTLAKQIALPLSNKDRCSYYLFFLGSLVGWINRFFLSEI